MTDEEDKSSSSKDNVTEISSAKKKRVKKNPPKDGYRNRKYSPVRTKRAKKLRQQGQDALRDRIKAGNHHAQLAKCAQMFGDIQREVKSTHVDKVTPEFARKTTLRLQALVQKTRVHQILLNKFLPDAREGKDADEDHGGNAAETIGRAFANALQQDAG